MGDADYMAAFDLLLQPIIEQFDPQVRSALGHERCGFSCLSHCNSFISCGTGLIDYKQRSCGLQHRCSRAPGSRCAWAL